MRLWVEPSGQNLPLAAAEADAVIAALGGPPTQWVEAGGVRLVEGSLPRPEDPRRLADRLALARRVLLPGDPLPETELLGHMRAEGVAGRSACFRPLGRPSGARSRPEVARIAQAYVDGGGTIDLDHGERRIWIARTAPGRWVTAEEVPVADRASLRERRMPRLPFQRPVSLPPTLGRVAVNLARLVPGERVVDPFLGTGALMLEAATMGMRVSGGDRDPIMVRGAIENLTALGHEFERLSAADAAEAWSPPGGGLWDAVVTDPPYGRASGSGGEAPQELIRRTLPAWADLVRPDGHVVVILPGGDDPLEAPWRRIVNVPDRVHRSLTREFRVYERAR